MKPLLEMCLVDLSDLSCVDIHQEECFVLEENGGEEQVMSYNVVS